MILGELATTGEDCAVTEVNGSTGNLVRLDGKVVLVVGAGSGIGRASAEICAEAGAEVMLADIDEIQGRQVADAINLQGGTAAFTPSTLR